MLSAATRGVQADLLSDAPGLVLDADLHFALDHAVCAGVEVDDAICTEPHLPH